MANRSRLRMPRSKCQVRYHLSHSRIGMVVEVSPLNSSTDVLWERHSIRCNQASVTMRLCPGVSRAEFAFLARPRATSRALDSLYFV